MSQYLASKLLNHTFSGATPAEVYTPPATLYAALFTTAPTAAGGGVEVTGPGYARVAVASTVASWPHVTPGVRKENAYELVFPTATGSWGTVVAGGFYDAPTGGNLIYFADLDVANPYDNTDIARWLPGDVSFTMG